MRYLTFALTKGRLASKTLDMFEKIGITCEEMRDKDSRKLIFTNEELKLKFFLAKGPDVRRCVTKITDICCTILCKRSGCADLCRVWCSRYRYRR